MGFTRFEELEKRVNNLLKDCETLKCDNKKLGDHVEGKDAEIRGLKKKLARVNREKGEVSERVESLITRLNGLIQKA